MAESADTLDRRFMDFVLFQAQNAGLFLGKIPSPTTGETSLNLRAGRSVLESLEMLQEKSRGNLVKEEQDFLDKAVSNIQGLMKEAEQQEQPGEGEENDA
jgi:hypothetical protein